MGGLMIAVLCLAAAFLIALSQPPTGIGPARPTEELRNPRAVDAAELNERLGRGVNILGYDPIWSSGRPRFDDRHFRLIKDAGFDHVRINLRPFRDADPDLSGRLPETWLRTVDWVVEQARANRLLVVLDLHEFEVMGADPAGNRERFLSVWEQMAARYRSAPAEVLFEILNEPEGRGWSWSYWQFDSDFIVYDIPAEKWVEPIRMALLTG